MVERELPGKGRALVADRALRAGEVALQELPAVLVVEEECLSTICANCLQLAQQGETVASVTYLSVTSQAPQLTELAVSWA